MILWHLGTSLVAVWFVFRGNPRLDYRLVALGAILPDLVDKPVGRILWAERFETGHLWGHTLLVNVVLLCLAFLWRGRRRRAGVLVPVGSLLHLAEDGMWSRPQVFWWPAFGTAFPREPLPGGLWEVFNPLRSPGLALREVAGLGLVVWLLAAHRMLSVEGVRTLVRTGHLEA